ncbi:hypothetical protein KPH14_009242 [Odynerus spinipes]|uniref:Protein cueball n=1 Tax=Odynerus spinipes TaxID=1348599 RepID=A0AAD9RNW8_9HYME|nr:hypothetical protein KPH14_009242 [Odynerus spinipes]
MPCISLKHFLPVFFLLFAVHAITSDARSWDIAVVIGHEIDFFSRNQTLTGQATVAEAVSLRGIAYDDKTRTLYLSDTRNNVSIFSNDLTEKNFTSKPLLKKENGTYIMAIVFDSVSRTLFWSDGVKRVIMKMQVPIEGPPEEPVLLHKLTQIPYGIALDVCNSHIYWTNNDKYNPSIERSDLDGSNRITVVKGNLYEPMGLAIDHAEGKLYWSDDEEGIDFKIERSNLDGTEREIVIHNRNQKPVYLTVDQDSIYWSDWVHTAIWAMPKKNFTRSSSPIKFKSYHSLNKDADPAALIARDNVGTIDCTVLMRNRQEKKKSREKQENLIVAESYNNLTTSTEEVESVTEKSRLCLNGGAFDIVKNSCKCTFGYTGPACETYLCHNYCLQGDCIVNENGMPECKCPGTFTGERCEKDACDGHCLHEGECSVQNGVPSCKCKHPRTGSRCETLADLPELCAFFCASEQPGRVDSDTMSCRCAENNRTAEKMINFSESIGYKTLLFVLVALIGALTILIAVMSFYLHKLRRRPRIKKRFVVSKGGVTPLTSRPQIPDNQCEITIENCCNMNICETPCFEPKLRTPMARSSNTKKEEKNSLLDNMEGNSC